VVIVRSTMSNPTKRATRERVARIQKQME